MKKYQILNNQDSWECSYASVDSVKCRCGAAIKISDKKIYLPKELSSQAELPPLNISKNRWN